MSQFIKEELFIMIMNYDFLIKARVDKSMIDYIDRISKKLGCSRSECIRKIIFNAMVKEVER